ncbi:MAG: Aspartate-semialdehyde dehydrogenase [Candidatus Aerophobetes bacterium ADurb.Bin490]|nr:MAG: Aspartate-semialdehyde dehydrogenase [Candidatus Aerophobetes bacterium ADurb.Bin490]HPN64210.1 aspartate-semialdehyde dehydrogenase [Candidatus Goldiibacteriota bacterium]HRQ44025.1 aspartate-semialdehyde dehydrogenase [Candidatus Goldiibacteriota bacterium]
MSKQYNVAIMGATGAVGEIMRDILEERKFPVKDIKFLASERSKGKKMKYQGRDVEIEVLSPDSFKGVDIVLASAGASVSKEYVKHILDAKALIIDNSSAFRMDDDVPLVVPEVNPEDIRLNKGIIANPNCSTIIMLVPIKPIHDKAKIKRIVVSTYQATSGAGAKGMMELEQQAKDWAAGKEPKVEKFAYQILFNLIPHIDVFYEDGYTKEEMKMVNETRKIMHAPDMQITATTVRVPCLRSHSESVNIETEKKLTAKEVRELLEKAQGVTVQDDIHNKKYPMPLFVSGKDDVYVGRIREDFSIDKGINLWVVGDQLRKGAALNAVQIAEVVAKEGLK